MLSLAYVVLISITVSISSSVPAEKVEKNDLSNRIINGKQAEKNEYPFMAHLQGIDFRGNLEYICGASIISDTVVVTAAHCIDKYILQTYGNRISVKVGSIHFNDSEEGQTCSIAEFVVHPDFSKYDFNTGIINDIAVLKLADTIKFTQGVQTIPLPHKDHNAVETDEGKGIILGWGATYSNGSRQSNELLYGYNYASPISICSKTFKKNFTDSVLCLTTGNDTKHNYKYSAPCYWDSGGPFIQTVGNETVLVGITSFGKLPCGQYPTIYTLVNKYLDFITKYL